MCLLILHLLSLKNFEVFTTFLDLLPEVNDFLREPNVIFGHDSQLVFVFKQLVFFVGKEEL